MLEPGYRCGRVLHRKLLYRLALSKRPGFVHLLLVDEERHLPGARLPQGSVHVEQVNDLVLRRKECKRPVINLKFQIALCLVERLRLSRGERRYQLY